MDSIRQLSRIVNNIKNTASDASKRKLIPKRVERALDTFDTKVPFTMDFRSKLKETAYLSLYFKTPAPSRCCGTCYCSVCEQFTNQLTITLTYGYISGTLNIFDLDTKEKYTNFTEIDPDAGTLSVGDIRNLSQK